MAIFPALSPRIGPTTDPDRSSDETSQAEGAAADSAATEDALSGSQERSDPRPDAGPDDLAAPGNVEALNADLAEVVQRLRERKFAAARDRMDDLAAQAWPSSLIPRIQQYGALVDSVEVFWRSLQEGIDRAKAGRMIVWRGRKAPLVEKTEASVTILVDRRRVHLRRDSLSDEDVRALAEAVLDLDDPGNLVQLGAFLLLAEKGDPDEVQCMWNEAATAGEDVSMLLPFLQSPP